MALSSLPMARKERKELITGKEQVFCAGCLATMTPGHNPEKTHSRYLREYVRCD